MSNIWIPPEARPVDTEAARHARRAALALRIFDAICGEAQTAGYGRDPFTDGNRWKPYHRTAGEAKRAIYDALKADEGS